MNKYEKAWRKQQIRSSYYLPNVVYTIRESIMYKFNELRSLLNNIKFGSAPILFKDAYKAKLENIRSSIKTMNENDSR